MASGQLCECKWWSIHSRCIINEINFFFRLVFDKAELQCTQASWLFMCSFLSCLVFVGVIELYCPRVLASKCSCLHSVLLVLLLQPSHECWLMRWFTCANEASDSLCIIVDVTMPHPAHCTNNTTLTSTISQRWPISGLHLADFWDTEQTSLPGGNNTCPINHTTLSLMFRAFIAMAAEVIGRRAFKPLQEVIDIFKSHECQAWANR